MSLRMGSHGPDVQRVQEMLIRLGADITADGYFGAQTDRAVREAKRRIGIFPPDGRLGQRALRAIEAADDDPASDRVAQPLASGQHTDMSLAPEHIGDSAVVVTDVHLARSWAQQFPKVFDLPASPSTMATSDAGLRFIEDEEESPVTHRVHWPKGGSGVTLGPGYDMRYKSASEIVHDLMLINVPRSTAIAISAASGLHGSAASDFCKQNKYTIDLSKAQQAALLSATVGKYENMIQSGVTVPLYKHEFDALVSFAYNPGHALHNVLHAINNGRVADAMKFIAAVDTSGGVVMDGLRTRRRREIALYLYGRYHD